MKKIFLSLLCTTIIAIAANAQAFEGKLTYKMQVKGENAQLYNMMMPNSADIFILGQNTLIRMNGGVKNTGDIISRGAEKKAYMVDHQKKTVYTFKDKQTESKEKPTVENKGTETINGYKCTKYLVKYPKQGDKEVYQYMWTTTDIEISKPENTGSAFFAEGIEGMTVKIDMYITAMGQVINMEYVLDKVSKEKPDAAMFEIPKKYKVEEFDEKKLMK